MALRRLVGTVTQGSADAFAESEILTGLSNLTTQALRLRRVEFYNLILPSADSEIQVQISRRSLSAINQLAASCIVGYGRKVELTTSGSPVYETFPNAQDFDRDMELLIVEEVLYFQIDSASTGAANVAGVVLWVENRTITANEKLSLQAATLA